jgi:hypothetical protein
MEAAVVQVARPSQFRSVCCDTPSSFEAWQMVAPNRAQQPDGLNPNSGGTADECVARGLLSGKTGRPSIKVSTRAGQLQGQ